ncbi:arsenite efflux transporter metallochaperone ArsD [Lacrimispora sp. 38-1]|uniref:arsenite efflux transporter metallochaperone ArsD n=1 Tax=Lacrimispora sp. 38-1 TaxID=3125778 RepID=UPI003CE82E22
MKTMKIYEPAMCCSTGLCGVGVDPELLRISTVLNTLENNGVLVNRFNLSNDPQEFVTNKTINNYVKENGVDGLPVVVIDDEIAITRRYPSNDEFVKLLNVPKSYIGEKPSPAKATDNKNQGCGCSGGDCCC